MLDIKRIREDFDGVKKAVESRGKGDFGIDKVREFDIRRREILATVEKMKNEYDQRRRWLVKALNDIGLDCFEPRGAFYVFPSIKSTGLSSEVFCERLLNERDVAVVPGNAFGDSGEGFIRISYAYSLKHIMTAVERIESFIKK